MSLNSRQYTIGQAIKSVLEDDTDLTAAGFATWKHQKLPIHRGATWDEGAYIAPLIPVEESNETRKDFVTYRFAAAIVDIGEAALTGANLSGNLAAIERVEDIFRNRGHRDAPAGMTDLNTDLTGADAFAFQKTFLSPADRFVAAAWQLGYDISATVINVSVNFARRDVSTLGA